MKFQHVPPRLLGEGSEKNPDRRKVNVSSQSILEPSTKDKGCPVVSTFLSCFGPSIPYSQDAL